MKNVIKIWITKKNSNQNKEYHSDCKLKIISDFLGRVFSGWTCCWLFYLYCFWNSTNIVQILQKSMLHTNSWSLFLPSQTNQFVVFSIIINKYSYVFFLSETSASTWLKEQILNAIHQQNRTVLPEGRLSPANRYLWMTKTIATIWWKFQSQQQYATAYTKGKWMYEVGLIYGFFQHVRFYLPIAYNSPLLSCIFLCFSFCISGVIAIKCLDLNGVSSGIAFDDVSHGPL